MSASPEAPPAGHAARFLAGWTRLDPDGFAPVYVGASVHGAARWPNLAVDFGADVIAAACAEAERRGFLGELARRVANVEAQLLGRAGDEALRLLEVVGARNVLHAMTDHARGLLDIRMLPGLVQAANACAEVRDEGGTAGTAFLVGRDLVLTAAHVVLDHRDGSWLATLRPGLTFGFLEERNAFDGARVPVPAHGPAHGGEPLSYAFPFATPPKALEPDFDRPEPPLAGDALDFALVRLARPVEHLEPIDIRSPAEPPRNRLCFVMGFGGGSMFQFDADPIFQVHEKAGRLTNRSNAMAGFSGGCCVGADGRVVGIHEGSFTADAAHDGYVAAALYNRAVRLHDIRRSMCAPGPDPLLQRAPATVGIDDAAMTRALYMTGLRLAGPAGENGWRARACAYMGVPAVPEKLDFPPFHPLLRRGPLENWLKRAARPEAERLCLIRGEAGAGKSFCVELIARTLAEPEVDLVRLTATRTSACSFEDAVGNRLGAGVDGRAAGPGRMEAIADAMSTSYGVPRAADRPRFVAIDFETSDGSLPDREAWYAFVAALVRRPWARVAVIGLSVEEGDELERRIEAEDQPDDAGVLSVTLGHPTVDDLLRFARELLRDREPPVAAAQRDAQVRALWDSSEAMRAERPELRTAQVALSAIALRRFHAGGGADLAAFLRGVEAEAERIGAVLGDPGAQWRSPAARLAHDLRTRLAVRGWIDPTLLRDEAIGDQAFADALRAVAPDVETSHALHPDAWYLKEPLRRRIVADRDPAVLREELRIERWGRDGSDPVRLALRRELGVDPGPPLPEDQAAALPAAALGLA